MPKKEKTTGVIVARFQVPDLHEGHRNLIDFVKSRHEKVIIVLGLATFVYTHNNPLDFETRKLMIKQIYPDVDVLYINDTYSDYVWSNKLDSIISTNSPYDDITLYGSRDSFIKYYHGIYKTYEYKPKVIISGTEIRNKITKETKSTYDYRAGIIKGVTNIPIFAIPTVDLLFVDSERNEILLGKEKNTDNYRFIGGFVKSNETLFSAVQRIALTKLSITIDKHCIRYVDSYVINDWRWKNEKQKITTTLFKIINIKSGNIEPNDNIIEVAWFPLNKNISNNIVQHHREMFFDVVNKEK